MIFYRSRGGAFHSAARGIFCAQLCLGAAFSARNLFSAQLPLRTIFSCAQPFLRAVFHTNFRAFPRTYAFVREIARKLVRAKISTNKVDSMNH